MGFKNFEIVITSLPYRENLVAEIYYKNEQWVEISNEKQQLIVQFYGPLAEQYWEFSLDEALEALEKARLKLIGFEKKKE
jgi:hypothetical protein